MTLERTEFQKQATAVALIKLFNERTFNICDFEKLVEILGRKDYNGGKDSLALHALHCVAWADMGVDCARLTKLKCLEILGISPELMKTVNPEKNETKSEPAKRLRLAFWK